MEKPNKRPDKPRDKTVIMEKPGVQKKNEELEKDPRFWQDVGDFEKIPDKLEQFQALETAVNFREFAKSGEAKGQEDKDSARVLEALKSKLKSLEGDPDNTDIKLYLEERKRKEQEKKLAFESAQKEAAEQRKKDEEERTAGIGEVRKEIKAKYEPSAKIENNATMKNPDELKHIRNLSQEQLEQRLSSSQKETVKLTREQLERHHGKKLRDQESKDSAA